MCAFNVYFRFFHLNFKCGSDAVQIFIYFFIIFFLLFFIYVLSFFLSFFLSFYFFRKKMKNGRCDKKLTRALKLKITYSRANTQGKQTYIYKAHFERKISHFENNTNICLNTKSHFENNVRGVELAPCSSCAQPRRPTRLRDRCGGGRASGRRRCSGGECCGGSTR